MGGTAIGFGCIQRQICVSQQLVRILSVGRCDGNSDAHIGDNLVFLERVGTLESVTDALREHGRISVSAQPGLHDGKFISPEPGDDIAFPHEALQAFRHCPQQFVAHCMSECIVDILEQIQIEIMDRQAFVAAQA
jgi:hypothetical protein